MDKKFIGIVLNNIDYKEKDKLVHIFSVEDGLVIGKLKSVKGASSKLKVLASPFCLAEFTGATKSNYLTITGGSVLETFFDLTMDIEKYYAGCCMLHCVEYCIKNGEQNTTAIFQLLISNLKDLCYGKVQTKAILIRFLTNILTVLGFSLNVHKCSNCASLIKQNAYIDLFDGSVKCFHCLPLKNLEIENEERQLFENVSSLENLVETTYFNEQSLKKLLKLLGNYIYVQLGFKIKIEELIK